MLPFMPACRPFLLFVIILRLVLAWPVTAQERATASNSSWKFAVSGDSRNCGDVVMPAIADSVLKGDAQFYWHLGDYRAIYTFDEDYRRLNPPATTS